MTITDIDPPPGEPIVLSYAKTFLRVDHSDDDALISDLIRSARERVETIIHGSLISRRRLYAAARFQPSGLVINHSQIVSVERVAVMGAEQTAVNVPLDALEINLRCNPVQLCLKDGRRWSYYAPKPVMIEAEITAGYGAQPEDIPMPLRQAVLLLLAQSYEHRDTDHPGVPMMVDALTMPYRGVRL